MNDKIIINTISKIHFIIISALSFIFLTLSILFILLQNGIYIENISLPNLQFKKLYIKWNEKLNISLQEANIVKKYKQNNQNTTPKQIDKLFKTIFLFNNWFEKIEINKIIFNDINASFKYSQKDKGFLTIDSKDFSLQATMFFESGFLNTKITQLNDYKRNIKITGNIIINTQDKIELITSLNLNINNDIDLNIYTLANKEKLFYKADSLKDIKSIKHIIEIFDMPKEAKYWAYDAIKMSSVKLKSLYGWIKYDDISNAYKNLHVIADTKDLQYTYNISLEPVVTSHTELEFKNGVLFIKPKEAYQYGFYLNKSWLKIDFSKKEELLTLFLLFDGKVNKDLLFLLNSYKIKLPFLQNSGSVTTNLKIEVNLRTIDVTAKGDFFTKKANFNYLGLNIDIFDAYIALNNYDVSIKNMHSKYKDIAIADVDVEFNAKENEGIINFKVQDIEFKDIDLKLKKQNIPLNIKYKISNKQDTINLGSSSWLFKNKNINIEALSVPFNLDSLTAKVPTTLVSIDNLNSYISGNLSLKPIKVDFDIDLLKFKIDDISMNQSSVSLNLRYDNGLHIKLNEGARFEIYGLEYIFSDLALGLKNNKLNIINSSLKIENLVEMQFNGNLLLNNNTGKFKIKKLDFKNQKLGRIFSSKENIILNINSQNNSIYLDVPQLDIKCILKEKGWDLKFNSLTQISKKSQLLKDYNINNGKAKISKSNNDKNIKFLVTTKYPYKLLVNGNKPIENYNIDGEINDDTNSITLRVNNLLEATITDKDIALSMKDVGINIDEIFNYLDKQKENATNNINISINASNSYIYLSKDRHIISDSMKLQYFNNILSAQLNHKQGSAGFKYEDKKFYLYGENFGDKFMDQLFALSKFKGGKLSFSMAGTSTNYKGLFYIKDTTVLQYKILNNILAFINTVPSLVTFQIPGYNKTGMEVKTAYMNFHFKNDIFNISDISLDSKEMDIVGKGNASIKNNTIDLKLNLKSDIGSSASKIPLVGYIVLGEDTISTSMKISGKLNDPDVKSLIAEDIVVAPLNIIKRTLYLPFHLLNKE